MVFQALRCVVIDDSLFIRESISAVIKEAGHQIAGSFGDGPSFLKEFENMKPDAIFLDIILPQMNGMEVLTKIQEMKPETPVIMLSGVAQSDAVSAALRLGAIDFLQKPVSKDRVTTLLDKIADNREMPNLEQLSTIGVAVTVLAEFLDEVMAHSSANLRHEIRNQIMIILEELKESSQGMFIINSIDRHIELDSQLWGVYSEEEVMSRVSKIADDLKFELQFLYSEEFIDNLYLQAITTMSAKKHLAYLFDYVNPTDIGLPPIPAQIDQNMQYRVAATTYDELQLSLSLAVLNVTDFGPEIVVQLDNGLLTETEYMKNSIFFYTLVGQGENFQEGLFGPLPVTSENKVSSLVYVSRIEGKTLLVCLYFTDNAERIVADYTRISFLIKTRLTPLNSVDELNKTVLKRIQDDLIMYLMEN